LPIHVVRKKPSLYDEISYLGFPFSLSPTFQMRNTNSSMEESVQRVDRSWNSVSRIKKNWLFTSAWVLAIPTVMFIMKIFLQWANEWPEKGIILFRWLIPSDCNTFGQISKALQTLIPAYPNATIGVHLHSTPQNWQAKLMQRSMQVVNGLMVH
jgi:hydroxymethylglutaryl-CoA lyase